MIDTLPQPQVTQRASPAAQQEQAKRAGSSVWPLAACVALTIVSIFLVTRIYRQNAALAEVKAQLAQSEFRSEQVQASLDAGRAQLSALQAQMATEQSQRSDLESQLAKAKAQSAGLQAQVYGDQKQRSDLQAELGAAKAQLAGASQETSTLRTQLDQAKAQSAGLQDQLSRAQGDLARLHPLIVQARRLPLTIAFEKSFWDQGFTLHITNPGTESLNLRIAISGADRTRAQMAVIEGGATLNVPSLPAGEKVVIASEGFDPLDLTAR
jgi:hypothetical protein